MRPTLVSMVAAALFLGSAAAGHAGQVSQPMNVSLTIGTPGGQVSLIVGPLVLTGPSAGPASASGTAVVHVTATANLPYVITLNEGLHRSAGSSRNLQGAGTSLPYYIHRDDAFGQLWGNSATDPFLGPGVTGIGTGSDQAYTAYAVTINYGLFGESLADGTYTDVVTVAVDF